MAYLNVHFSKTGAFPNRRFSLITAPLPAKCAFTEFNQYWITAPTNLLCIFLAGLLYEGVQTLIFFSWLCRLQESRLYDPCSLLHFHYVSDCAQFARTDSCLLLCGRQSENIEPGHSTMRLQHRHNSDSSKKCSMGRVPAPPSIFHQTFSVIKSKD